MAIPQTLDIHAHILEQETMRTIRTEVPQVNFEFRPIDDEWAELHTNGAVYKPFPRGGWDVERRLADMDRYGFGRQVVAVSPQTVLYEAAPEVCLAVSRIQNDAIAARAKATDRLLGLATVPMQAPEMAAEELARAMGQGHVGAMIGTNIEGRNLDDPALEPFWAEAERLGAFLLLHPLKIAGVERMRSYWLQNLVGNPLDTTIAAASLVFGGVLERFPGLKVVLSHGGGFVPYQMARWQHGWEERAEPKARLRGEPGPSLDRLLYDTILHEGPALQFLVDKVGAGRVMLGTDYPFDMGQYDLIEVIDGLRLTKAQREGLLHASAEALLPGGAR